jgi:hypothetical protein
VTEEVFPTFGDHVRIRRAPETEALGLAGLEGVVFGESRPSSSGVHVVGPAPVDYVLNVFIEEREEDFWLRPELVQFLDHAPGQRVHLDGVPHIWERQVDGSWVDVSETTSANKQGPKPKDSPEGGWVDRSLQRPVREETAVTRFLSWLERFLPKLG